MKAELLISDLEAGAAMIPSLLVGITQEEAQIRPTPENWSVLDVMCHFLDEERRDFRVRLEYTLFHPQDMWPMIDPPGWVTTHRYAEQNLQDVVIQFLFERRNSVEWLRGLESPNWDAPYTAPWGQITAGDLLCSWVAHDNLHIRQLVELRRARIEQIAAPYGIGYAGDW